MRLGYSLLLGFVFFQVCLQSKILDDCRFARTFYQRHPNVFQLDDNQRSLTVQPFYALSNQSVSTLSIGIIYRLAETYLVPVPLLLQCSDKEMIYAPIDCDMTMIDTRSSDLSLRAAESTRTTTVPLTFRDYSISGAYFKQSTVALRNCRLSSGENLRTSSVFHLRIEFEQRIHSPCTHKCIHPQLYQCSSASNSCQCRSGEPAGSLCIDTELRSNCSLTPERCRRLSDQIQADSHCLECDSSETFVPGPPLIFIGLLSCALLVIIILIIALIKMRSIRCVKFVHSSPGSLTRLSSSSSSTKSTDQICERYTRVNLYE